MPLAAASDFTATPIWSMLNIKNLHALTNVVAYRVLRQSLRPENTGRVCVQQPLRRIAPARHVLIARAPGLTAHRAAFRPAYLASSARCAAEAIHLFAGIPRN